MATGLEDFGDDWFRGPLSAWAEDLKQPSLNAFGRSFLRTQAVKNLARRLRVLEVMRCHEEIAQVVIPPIVYVTGLARSGTTLLHNLLGLHPQARTFKRWELVEPVPPPETATYDNDARISEIQRQVDRMRGTFLERMHWVNAADPEECAWGFLDANSMLGQAPTSWMPGWRAFLHDEDQTPTFSNHRRLVQLLVWRHAVPPGGFLVLKAPQIAGRLDELAAVFPEARFVLTHRDPYRCTVSLAGLCEAVGAPFLDDNPLTDDGRRGRLTLANNRRPLERMVAFSSANPERVTHVAYPELVNDPVEVVRATLGADLSDQIDRFLAEQRAGRRAAPPQELGNMGYDPGDVWSDPGVAAYTRRFQVVPERARLTG